MPSASRMTSMPIRRYESLRCCVDGRRSVASRCASTHSVTSQRLDAAARYFELCQASSGERPSMRCPRRLIRARGPPGPGIDVYPHRPTSPGCACVRFDQAVGHCEWSSPAAARHTLISSSSACATSGSEALRPGRCGACRSTRRRGRPDRGRRGRGRRRRRQGDRSATGPVRRWAATGLVIDCQSRPECCPRWLLADRR